MLVNGLHQSGARQALVLLHPILRNRNLVWERRSRKDLGHQRVWVKRDRRDERLQLARTLRSRVGCTAAIVRSI